ncbi:phage tail protein [Photorhabdus heterorhabditis]|uniref:phage tail protein n=1 Tax=Photorhabdus heterorhabditis TaxID=880156 RepID=UPI0009FB36E5|nr:phage tail protein [Photorhabdus heterorhabditis]
MNPKNDFKAFSIKDGANVVDQNLYENSPELQTGFPPIGLTTHVLNKTLRQSSTIASVVADFIATESGSDVLDDGNIAKLTAQLNKALEKKITTQVPDASLTQKGVVQLTDMVGNSNTLAATQKLVSDINNNANNRLEKTQNGADIPNKNEFVKNLGLKEAAKREIGNTANQIPDASFFSSKLDNDKGWWKSPSGIIEQYVRVIMKSNSNSKNATYHERRANVSFPIAFPTAFLGASVSVTDTVGPYIETPLVANASKTSITVWTGLYLPVGVHGAFPDSDIIVYLRVWGR